MGRAYSRKISQVSRPANSSCFKASGDMSNWDSKIHNNGLFVFCLSKKLTPDEELAFLGVYL